MVFNHTLIVRQQLASFKSAINVRVHKLSSSIVWSNRLTCLDEQTLQIVGTNMAHKTTTTDLCMLLRVHCMYIYIYKDMPDFTCFGGYWVRLSPFDQATPLEHCSSMFCEVLGFASPLCLANLT